MFDLYRDLDGLRGVVREHTDQLETIRRLPWRVVLVAAVLACTWATTRLAYHALMVWAALALADWSPFAEPPRHGVPVGVALTALAAFGTVWTCLVTGWARREW